MASETRFASILNRVKAALPESSTARFGIFELDEAAGELRKNGSVVKLSPQPFHVLRLLVRSAGELVDRDTIRREVWGETAVDFDRSLNVCIAQIRSALNDDAESPRFIQTLPRRGYRFLASVDRDPEAPPVPSPPNKRRRPIAIALALTLALLAAAAAWRYWPPADEGVRIAVLPFAGVGIAEKEQIQIEGLFDELLTNLGGIQPDRLRVIGRSSVWRFRLQPESLRQVGQKLGVSYLVEATARKEGERLRVAARLIKADSENVIWSETLVQDTAPPEFEERFVARVSAAVLRKLFPEARPQQSAEAGCRDHWEMYRAGRQLANRGTIADLERSIGYLEKAACGGGQAALAETLTRLGRITGNRPDFWDRARVAAKAALAYDANSAGAHVSQANVAFWRDWDWNSSEQAFQTALRLNPSDSGAHHDYAWLLMARGRRAEALASLQRAMALDPLSPRINMDAGWLLLQAGRFREAAAQGRRALELDPKMREASACVSRALLYSGDYRGAFETIQFLISDEDRRFVAGLPPEKAIMALFHKSLRPKGQMDPYQRAWRLAWTGAREEALSEIEDAFRRRSTMMPLVAVDPAFASIRKEARFRKVVQDMGL